MHVRFLTKFNHSQSAQLTASPRLAVTVISGHRSLWRWHISIVSYLVKRTEVQLQAAYLYRVRMRTIPVTYTQNN